MNTERMTVVTLYSEDACDHYVGVVAGTLTDQQKARLAVHYDAVIGVQGDDPLSEENNRVLYFAVVEPVEDPRKLAALLNIDGEYPTTTLARSGSELV